MSLKEYEQLWKHDIVELLSCNRLHFKLVEDTYQPEQDNRWVVVAPPGSNGTTLLLARASTPDQEAFIRPPVEAP